MRSVDLKVLKSRLSKYVRLTASGETVLVTDRDLAVAELCTPEGRSAFAFDAHLAEAVRLGRLKRPLLVGSEPPPSHPVPSLGELVRELDANRENR